MKKVFGIAAMLLALAACNKIETEIQTTDQAEGITITAQLAPKTGGATIEFTVEAGTPDNTACTLVYPYSAAKDDHTRVRRFRCRG